MPKGRPSKKVVKKTEPTVVQGHAEPVTSPPAKTLDDYRAISDSVDGWLTSAEADLLVRTAETEWKPNCLWVEVGSYLGKSTVLLGGVLAQHKSGQFYACDPHLGDLSYPTRWQDELLESDKLHNVGSTLTRFRETIDDADLRDYVSVVQSFSIDYAPPGMVDLIFIDGLHSYEDVKEDYTHFKQFFNVGAAVLFHDFNTWYGPHKVVTDAVAMGELEIVSQGDSLCVCKFLGVK